MTLVHLVARAVQDAGPTAHDKFQDLQDLHDRLPALGAVITVTTILFFVLAATVRYIYGELIATLAFIESPATTVITSTPPPASPKEPLLSQDNKKSALDDSDDVDAPPPYEEEILLVRSRPITSSLRGALQHLRSRVGGRHDSARFRGLPLHILHAVAVHLVASLVAPFAIVGHGARGGALAVRCLALVAANVVAAPLALAWTHHVLSDPAQPATVSWLRRVFGLKWAQIRRVLLPAALLALSEQFAMFAPVALFMCATHARGAHHVPVDASSVRGAAAITSGLLGLLMFVALVIPAQAAFVRVAASTAPEDEDAVVPFDRSFGGYLKDGKLGIVDAWRSFGWSARRRVLGVYVKVVAIQIALFAGWLAVTAMELRIFGGEELPKFLKANGRHFF